MAKLQVTSKGCSRGFILAALFRCLEYVRNEKEKGNKVQPPFPEDEIAGWLEQAQEDCVDAEFQKGLGGTVFDVNDECTYWTQPKQFATWWKNNVERKTKFKLLQDDANVPADCDEKTRQRSNYCRNAISLALSIKNFFSRTINKNGVDGPIIQYILPYPMPPHMTFPVNDSTTSSRGGGQAITMGQHHVPLGSMGASGNASANRKKSNAGAKKKKTPAKRRHAKKRYDDIDDYSAASSSSEEEEEEMPSSSDSGSDNEMDHRHVHDHDDEEDQEYTNSGRPKRSRRVTRPWSASGANSRGRQRERGMEGCTDRDYPSLSSSSSSSSNGIISTGTIGNLVNGNVNGGWMGSGDGTHRHGGLDALANGYFSYGEERDMADIRDSTAHKAALGIFSLSSLMSPSGMSQKSNNEEDSMDFGNERNGESFMDDMSKIYQTMLNSPHPPTSQQQRPFSPQPHAQSAYRMNGDSDAMIGGSRGSISSPLFLSPNPTKSNHRYHDHHNNNDHDNDSAGLGGHANGPTPTHSGPIKKRAIYGATYSSMFSPTTTTLSSSSSSSSFASLSASSSSSSSACSSTSSSPSPTSSSMIWGPEETLMNQLAQELNPHPITNGQAARHFPTDGCLTSPSGTHKHACPPTPATPNVWYKFHQIPSGEMDLGQGLGQGQGQGQGLDPSNTFPGPAHNNDTMDITEGMSPRYNHHPHNGSPWLQGFKFTPDPVLPASVLVVSSTGPGTHPSPSSHPTSHSSSSSHLLNTLSSLILPHNNNNNNSNNNSNSNNNHNHNASSASSSSSMLSSSSTTSNPLAGSICLLSRQLSPRRQPSFGSIPTRSSNARGSGLASPRTRASPGRGLRLASESTVGLINNPFSANNPFSSARGITTTHTTGTVAHNKTTSRSLSRTSTFTPSTHSHVLLANAVIITSTPADKIVDKAADNTADNNSQNGSAYAGGDTASGDALVSTKSSKRTPKAPSKPTTIPSTTTTPPVTTTTPPVTTTPTPPSANGKYKSRVKGLPTATSSVTEAVADTATGSSSGKANGKTSRNGGSRNGTTHDGKTGGKNGEGKKKEGEDHGNGLFKTMTAVTLSPTKHRHLKRHLSPYAMQAPLLHTTTTTTTPGKNNSTTRSSSRASATGGAASSGAGSNGVNGLSLGGSNEKRVRFSEKEEVYLINKDSSSQGPGLVE